MVAAIIAGAILRLDPTLGAEHVGSTSVPGCGGKGVIDLAVLYPPEGLARARDVVDRLGFQRQPGPEPFPESRPMRVGAYQFAGRVYFVHAHVLEMGCSEHSELLAFRESLRSSPARRKAYESNKRSILSSGVTDSAEYARIKGAFVREVLEGRISGAK